MKITDILNTDYSGKLIYREDWNAYHPHKAIRLGLTDASLVYVPTSKKKKIETMETDYKFSLFEIMCNDWQFYKD